VQPVPQAHNMRQVGGGNRGILHSPSTYDRNLPYASERGSNPTLFSPLFEKVAR
jgi:hypothetical protein